MKVYALYHSVMHEGNDLIAIYAKEERAELEAKKLETEYHVKTKTAWEKMSKTNQKFWRSYENYSQKESFDVVGYEVVE